MKKKLYIHVGPHKTGTTLLQKICLDNKETLSELGISYPNVFFNFLGHHQLVDKARNKKVTDDEIENLIQLNSDILLSSENFIDLTKSQWQYIKKRFDAFDIHIVYAWRRTSFKMYSMWQEAIKHGEKASFYQYYYSDLIKPGVSRQLMQTINIDLLAKVFNKEHLHLLDYDELSEQQSLISEFFNLFNVDVQSLKLDTYNQGIKNVALPSTLTELLRCLNAYHQQQGHAKSSQIREVFFANQDKFTDQIQQIQTMMKSHIDRIEFGNYFVDNNSEQQISKKYQEQLIGYSKPTKNIAMDIINPDWLLTPNASQLIIDVYNALK